MKTTTGINTAVVFFVLATLFISCPISILAANHPLPQDIEIPKRIVSLGPRVTESLYLLEVQDRLVACTIYCKRPSQAETKPKIGTVAKADVEKIVSLKPDLVIAINLTSPKTIEKLKLMGIRVETLKQPVNFAELCRQFLRIGELVGRKDKAIEIVDRATKRVASLNKQVEGLEKPTVFFQLGAKPLFTVTKQSFTNDYIEQAGGINIAEGAEIGFYSREQVLKKNPDVIVIVKMGIAGEEEKALWKRFSTLNAVKNQRIHIVDSYKYCSPTPDTFAGSLQEMVGILHPNLEIGRK